MQVCGASLHTLLCEAFTLQQRNVILLHINNLQIML